MSKFKLPENLDGLDVDGLLDLRSEAKKAIADLVKDDAPSDDQLTEAEAIAEFIEQADSRIEEVRTEEADKQAKLDRLRAAAEEEVEEEDSENPSDETDPEAGPDEDEDTEEVEVEEAEKEAVAASAKPKPKTSAVARARKNAKEPEAPSMNRGKLAITASADVPNVAAGKELSDLDEVAKIAQSRLKSYPTHRIGGNAGTRMRNGIAQLDFSVARTDGMYQGNPDFKDEQAVIMAASKEARLAGQSLTAAGGWCAPSETLYDFCSEESTDGILSLPSMTVNRGSIRWTKGPDFNAIYDNEDGDWLLTETEVEADTVKPCIEVECAPFEETVLDVTGVCIKAGILTNAAYPELVRRYTEAVLIAHQHKVGGRLYQAINSAATELTIAGGATAYDSLTHMEIAIMHMRERKRMSMNTTMEVLAPHWYKAVIRGDLARRNGVDLLNVSDAQIQSYFSSRGANVQWLYNTGQDIDNTDGTLTIPETVALTIYPAGSFVKLTTDLITLDGIYDSTNLSTNTYTALFTEEGYGVVNPCGDAYRVNVQTCITGQTGAADLAECLVAPTAP